MQIETFQDGLDEIYSIFGKKAPEERIASTIYKRIRNFPDKFMKYAIEHFENQEKLPSNLIYYLKQILWPEFLERNPELKSNINYSICPQCNPDLPGWRRVWMAELTGWDEIVYVPVDVRCSCGNARNPRNEPIFTDNELLANGFYLENPDKNKFQAQLERWNKSAWQNVIGLQPETSEAHKKYIEEFVEEDF